MHRDAGAPARPQVAAEDVRHPPPVLDVDRGVQSEEAFQGPHRLLAVGVLGPDHLIDDRPRYETDHQKDGDGDAEESRDEG